MESWRLFWAKTNREQLPDLPADWTHPLWAHLLDVGSAAQVLWDQFLPAVLKQKMATALGLEQAAAGRFLSIWIGLHDLGKGIPGFQEMHAPTKERLTAVGLVFYERPNRLHHGHATIAILHNWLREKQVPYDSLLDAVAACVGIHHGKLCYSDVWEEVAEDQVAQAVLGNAAWRSAQRALAEAVFTAWGAQWPAPQVLAQADTVLGDWPDWLMAFAGWATLADWLGSMQSCYDTSVQAADALAVYLAKSRAGAEEAFRTAGLAHQGALRAKAFSAHFGNQPRPLQEIARDLPLSAPGPHLVIVEAPTGEGKTEAAFYLAARFGGGLYVAMPSQSTSDGLHPRLRTFLAGDAATARVGAHAGEAAALRLVHGNDLLNDDALALVAVAAGTAFIGDAAADRADAPQPDPQATGRVLGWFMPKKRALLVPYGVGTVDQLFLGVLYARHFFLRLFALSGKTVIFDEVHAYDTYMNVLFERLLSWLRALDVHVIVLSATLPGQTRAAMLRAWGAAPVEAPGPADPYPVAWHAAAATTCRLPFAPTPGREQYLTFRWCSAEIADIATLARTLLAQGATVLIICNQVSRAQQVFALLDDDALLPAADRLLLHARMPQAWRKQRETTALSRFGPRRPDKPALLVGTQVVEQSLDLDADALITDLAPIDLLLQRAGRLHRHQRPNRPTGFTEPVLYVASCEAPADALPDVELVSGAGHIYPPPVLWKTYAALHQHGGWALPRGAGTLPGYRALVEQVYGELAVPPLGLSAAEHERYELAATTWTSKVASQKGEATRRVVPPPSRLQDLFTFQKAELVEEDDTVNGEVAKHLLAATRNPDGVNAEVLLLHRTERGWSVEPGGPTVLYRSRAGFLSPSVIRTLFGASIRLSQPGVVTQLWKQPHEDWPNMQQQHRLLQRFQLLELEQGAAQVGNYRLRLDTRLGLLIEKTETEEYTSPQCREKGRV